MKHRIFILGAPGAGKSTLAQALAKALGIPAYATDPIAYVDAQWTLRDLGERQRLVQAIAAQDSWIVEGNHLGWTNPFVTSADQIIWLDPPLWFLLWRVTKRHIGWAWESRPRRLDVKALWDDYRYQSRFAAQKYIQEVDLENDQGISHAAAAAVLAPYRAKVFCYRHLKGFDVRKFSTDLLGGGWGTPPPPFQERIHSRKKF
jgi:adenylate kinase family enzyme